MRAPAPRESSTLASSFQKTVRTSFYGIQSLATIVTPLGRLTRSLAHLFDRRLDKLASRYSYVCTDRDSDVRVRSGQCALLDQDTAEREIQWESRV